MSVETLNKPNHNNISDNAFNRARVEYEQRQKDEINRLLAFLIDQQAIEKRKKRKEKDQEPIFGDMDPMESVNFGIEMHPGVEIGLDNNENKGPEWETQGFGLAGELSLSVEKGDSPETAVSEFGASDQSSESDSGESGGSDGNE